MLVFEHSGAFRITSAQFMLTISDKIAAVIIAATLLILGYMLTGYGKCSHGCISVFVTAVVVCLFLAYVDTERRKRFLKKHEGKEFFCYTSRKRTRRFIEEEIIPALDPGIVIIFRHHSDYDAPGEFKPVVYHLICGIQGKRFPLLLKIRDEEIFSVSLYDAVHMNYRLEDGAERFFEELSTIRAKSYF